MLVVIIIISFAATVAILAFSNYRKGSSVSGAAWEVQSVLSTAKMRSIANNLPSQVVFDLNNHAFWIDDLQDTLAIKDPKAVAPHYLASDVTIESVKINSVELVSGEDDFAIVVFRPDGSNPYITVYLRGTHENADVDENYYTVQLYPSSAEPKVWPNARKN